ncbi:MAG TPA: helix-turn-helix domain-containing protein [Alicycliphilus sp.]|nr:helix-turn-helix domain-containing protein [Alicycliphilus sp.]
MNEPIGAQDTDQPAQARMPNAAGMSAGTLLRQGREAAGVHIDMLAGALKVPVAKLQALEADDYAAFPDHVFMRALASSMCRVLKVDVAPVLALLPQGAPLHLPPDRAINASFKDSGRRSGKGGSLEQPKSRLVGIAVVALLLGALAVAFLPLDMGIKDDKPALTLTPALPAPPAPVVQDSAAGPAEPVATPSTPSALEAQPANSMPAAAEPATAAPAASEGLLVIRAHKETWIQVRNGAGRVLLQKTLAAGDSYAAEGDPPWRVVIGRADAAEVTVRGQAMDMKAVSRENVARFEVK